MTQPSPPVPASGTAGAVPRKVAQLAAREQLGELVAARNGSNPIANAMMAGGASVAAFGLVALLSWVAVRFEMRFLRTVVIFLLVAGLVAAVMAVMALLAGFTSAYIYSGGLIRRKNGRLSWARWSDIDELLLWRAGGSLIGGTLLCYYAVTRSGRKLSVEAKVQDGRDPFGEQLQEMVQRAGGRVIESGPATGRMRP